MEALPGEEISNCHGCLIGHGAYTDLDRKGKKVVIASIKGAPARVDRLVTLEATRPWFIPESGDVVVGRIIGSANKRWYVDINTKTEAVLMLTAINLAGNVQRRKGELDEIMMKDYFTKEEVVIAEVQSTGNKTLLHTRNSKCKKIEFGTLLKFPPDFIAKGKTQFVTVKSEKKEVEVVLGLNGYIAVHGRPDSSREIKQTVQAIISIRRSHPRIDEGLLLEEVEALQSAV